MMNLRHGFTLVEVLAATVLLALIAAAATPLLQQAWRHLVDDDHGDEVDLLELGRFADEIIAEADRFDLKSPPPWGAGGAGGGPVEVGWTEQPAREPIEISIAPSEPASEEHVWLRFNCGKSFVLRRVPLPKPTETSQGGAP